MTVLVILAKAPLPGRAKTRLCPPLSPTEAAEIAAGALADTFAVAQQCRCFSRIVAVFDGQRAPWVPEQIDVISQVDGGLDRRLAAAFTDVNSRYGEPIVLIAMDTPHVGAADLDAAATALITHDATFGPADDGGFWLIGMRTYSRNMYEQVFLGVPMSIADTGAAQLARLHAAGLSVATLRGLQDIDTVDDVAAVAAAFPNLQVSKRWNALVSKAGA